MDEDRLISQLPDAHAVAVRLRRAGQPDALIALALGIPVEGVGPLVEVALAKLARLREPDADQGPRPTQ